MAFQPVVDQVIPIEMVNWHIAEHPSAPGIPYGQEGRTGTVYQLLQESGEAKALKVFRPRYRLPALVSLADKLEAFASLPGLEVCNRTVLTPRRHTGLLQQYPDLTYSVLMPWIKGPTWTEVILDKTFLTSDQSLAL